MPVFLCGACHNFYDLSSCSASCPHDNNGQPEPDIMKRLREAVDIGRSRGLDPEEVRRMMHRIVKDAGL